jgi:hypothetical protein
VSCGVASSGTGTLTALSNKTDLISVQLSFLLNSASSSISVVGGLNPSVGVATSGVGAEIQITPTIAKLPADPGAGTTGPGVVAATFCVELHLEESPPHVILDKASCTPKLTSSVSYENDTNSPARQGGLWGFVLNDATITGLTVNTSENFTD